MQTRDVAVFGKQDIPALAPAVHATLRDRESVARRVATDDQRQATDVALRRTAEALHIVGRSPLAFELLEADDFLPDAEQIPELEQARLVRSQLQVDAVQRVLVLDRQLSAAAREGRVARRQIAVTRKDRARVATKRDLRDVRQAVSAGLAAVCA